MGSDKTEVKINGRPMRVKKRRPHGDHSYDMNRFAIASILMTVVAVGWLLIVDDWFSPLNWMAYAVGLVAFMTVMTFRVSR